MYVMLGTQLDVYFTVNYLSQFGTNPAHEHLTTQHTIQYLVTTHHRCLMYGRNDSTELIRYSDSNWGGDKDNYHSTTGYTFILGGGPIMWETQKQRRVALSSTEAKYMALTECSKHVQ